MYIIKLIKFLPNLTCKNSPKSSQIKRQLISFEKHITHTEASKSQLLLYSNLKKKILTSSHLLLLSWIATRDSSLRSPEFLDILLCMPRKINNRSSLRGDSMLTVKCYKYGKSAVNIEKSQSLPNEIAIHFREVNFTDFFFKKRCLYLKVAMLSFIKTM